MVAVSFACLVLSFGDVCNFNILLYCLGIWLHQGKTHGVVNRMLGNCWSSGHYPSHSWLNQCSATSSRSHQSD